MMSNPIVLGFNFAYHQPSACIVRNGLVVAAVEEERLNRFKGGKRTHIDNTLVLPFQSINAVLRISGLSFSDIDLIATSFCADRRQRFSPDLVNHQPVIPGEYETISGDQAFRRLIALAPEVLAARFCMPPERVKERFRWVPHHVAHAASAFYASGFDRAAAMVVDGIGEYETASQFDCYNGAIDLIQEIFYPHSLGFVWEVFTNFLGFEGNYDESKIMGLAAYGNPARFRAAMRTLIRVDADGRFTTHLDATALTDNFSSLEIVLNMKRRLPYEPLAWQGKDRKHANLAAALQEVTNEVFVRQAEALRLKIGRNRLVLAGGVCLNCVANGAIAEQCGFDDIYVQPAAGDAGTCIGAALHAYRRERAAEWRCVKAMPTPFLGPSFDDSAIRLALDRYQLDFQIISDPAEKAAELLANDKIIGWFQGAMEFGPRALGNRSLLANPTSPDVRQTLNLKVKHREDFRPFCPTILAEDAAEWLDNARPLMAASRMMLMTYQVKRDKRVIVPAVLHRDGSSRVQVLHREDNPMFHNLLQKFKERTGVPVILNTSFNDREPIVCSPEDACKCYLKTRIDAMIIGNHLVHGPKSWEREPRLS